MGSTWGLLIPITILMASLRHKQVGWWFHLHRALAALSLVLVLIGVVLGRRLRITHPPVTFAGKCHKVMGYTAASFICLQVGTRQLDAIDSHLRLEADMSYSVRHATNFMSCS